MQVQVHQEEDSPVEASRVALQEVHQGGFPGAGGEDGPGVEEVD